MEMFVNIHTSFHLASLCNGGYLVIEVELTIS